MSAPITVLLADDHAVVREGIGLILSVEEDIAVLAQVSDGAAAVAYVQEHPVDVVLMDIQMPGVDGIDAARQIVASCPLTRVVMLTTFERDDYLFDAIDAGASGFLLKNTTPEHLAEAVRAAHAGQALLSPEVTLQVLRRAAQTPGAGAVPSVAATVTRMPDGAGLAGVSGLAGSAGAPLAASTPAPASGPTSIPGASGAPELTRREAEVLSLLAAGLSNQEIATELFVSEATVKTHVSNLLGKLGARDRVQAIVTAFRLGLATP